MKIRLVRVYEREGTKDDLKTLKDAARNGDEQVLVEFFEIGWGGNVSDEVSSS